MRCALNILVCGLRFLRIDHFYIMIFHGGSGIPLHLISIVDQDQPASLIALIIAQDIHQLIPGAVQVDLRKLPQLRPCENNIIAVHQQIFFRFFLRACFGLRCPHAVRLAARIVAAAAGRSMISSESVGILCPFPIGPTEDLFDLLLRYDTLCAAARLTYSSLPSVHCRHSL